MTATEADRERDNDIADAELIDEPPATTAALVPVHEQSPIVRPVASLQTTLDAFREYQAVRDKIVVASDYQSIGRDGKFVKKSGWRKLATAFGVSGKLISKDYERDTFGRVIQAEVVMCAIAPNGRTMDGLGICDYRERCCPRAYDDEAVCKNSSRYHTHCTLECDGFNHFSKPQHDIPATAFTRAYNRACSDLFAFGEVSAEEIGDQNEPADDNEWQPLVAAMNAIVDDAQRHGTKKAFANKFGMPNELTKGLLPAAQRFVEAAGGAIKAPAPQAAPVDMGPADSARENAGDAKPGVASNASSATEPSGQAPVGEGENAVGTAANLPAGENPVDDVPVGSPPPGDDAAGAGPPPDLPARPAVAPKSKASTAQQRQRLGMRCVDLATKGYLKPGDKAEIVGVLTQSRATSTVDITEAEASKMTTLLALIEQGDIEMVDDPDHPGERAVSAVTTRAEDFLGPIIRGA